MTHGYLTREIQEASDRGGGSIWRIVPVFGHYESQIVTLGMAPRVLASYERATAADCAWVVWITARHLAARPGDVRAELRRIGWRVWR